MSEPSQAEEHTVCVCVCALCTVSPYTSVRRCTDTLIRGDSIHSVWSWHFMTIDDWIEVSVCLFLSWLLKRIPHTESYLFYWLPKKNIYLYKRARNINLRNIRFGIWVEIWDIKNSFLDVEIPDANILSFYLPFLCSPSRCWFGCGYCCVCFFLLNLCQFFIGFTRTTILTETIIWILIISIEMTYTHCKFVTQTTFGTH